MKHLVKFRGIGPWTAEMVMMFSLLKPDLFSIGDMGLIGCKELNPALETKDEVVNLQSVGLHTGQQHVGFLANVRS